MKLAEQFTTQLADKTSQQFKDMEDKFCSEVMTLYIYCGRCSLTVKVWGSGGEGLDFESSPYSVVKSVENTFTIYFPLGGLVSVEWYKCIIYHTIHFFISISILLFHNIEDNFVDE